MSRDTDGATEGREATGTPEREVRRAGEDPPDIPAESTLEDLLPRLLEDVDSVATGYHVRATLPGENPNRAGQRLVDALERKVTVVGSTLDAGIDPADPQVDVLIQCEYTASQLASALGGVTPVRGAVVLEVTDICERVLDPPEETEEADAADANDVFSELQQQVSELDYDQVVDELEDVSFPGGPDPDEEVDLEAEADVVLSDDDADGGDVPLEDVALDEAALDADPDGSDEAESADGTSGDVLGSDDVDAKDLFGEGDAAADGSGTTGIVGGADERRIEEAIRSVEQSDEESADGSSEPSANGGSADGADVASGDGDPVANEPADADDASALDADDASTLANGDAGGPDVGASGGGETPAAETAAGTGSDGSGSPPGSSSAGGESAGDVDDFVEDLVAALESGAIGPERRQRLRDALGVESTHSLDVRLEYVQKRVDNLAAYTDAWEAFLAEEGTGTQFVESIDDIENRLAELEDRHEEVVARNDDPDEHDRRLDDVEESVESLRRSVEALGNWRDRVNELLGDRL